MWERQVANDLRAVDHVARRNLEYQEGGTRDIVTQLPFKVQCKNQKKEQGEMGVGAVKITNRGEFAIMTWNDFMMLVRQCFIIV